MLIASFNKALTQNVGPVDSIVRQVSGKHGEAQLAQPPCLILGQDPCLIIRVYHL